MNNIFWACMGSCFVGIFLSAISLPLLSEEIQHYFFFTGIALTIGGFGIYAFIDYRNDKKELEDMRKMWRNEYES